MVQATWRAAPLAVVVALSGCGAGLDLDLRNNIGKGTLDTSSGARAAVGKRPVPDERGILKYPNYEVAVARRGDTVGTVAARVGVNPAELARFNGLKSNTDLRDGEILALPKGVKSAPVKTSSGTAVTPTIVEISELEPAKTTANTTNTSEPGQHRVVSGETASIIARRYNIPVDVLAEWNGLNSKRTIRTGQVLLIPQKRDIENASAVTGPGEGTATPVPPSSTRPEPRENPGPEAPTPAAAAPVTDLKPATSVSSSKTKFVMPVQGSIIRDYKKGSNEGIDIAAPAGTSVRAADGGVVAAITKDTNGVPIVVIKHSGNILTVYTNVDNLSVKKGDAVKRGQTIAKVRAGSPSFVHFEVRKGLNSVDPNEYV